MAHLLRDARADTPEACAEPVADRLIRILAPARSASASAPTIRCSRPPRRLSAPATTSTWPRRSPRAWASGRCGCRCGRRRASRRWRRERPTSSSPRWATTRSATRRHGSSGRTTTSPRRSSSARARRTVRDWNDLSGRSICVTVGNYANSQLVSHGARLLLFDDASRLPRGLEDETCLLAAQDDSFFASYLGDPAFADALRAEVRLRSGAVGHGRAQGGQRALRPGAGAHQPDHASRRRVPGARPAERDLHGLSRAAARSLARARLRRHRRRAAIPPACCRRWSPSRRPPASPRRSEAALAWLDAPLGIVLTLPMLTSEPAWDLFREGVANSLAPGPGHSRRHAFGGARRRRRVGGVERAASRAGLARRGHPAVLAGGPHLVIAACDRACAVPYSTAVALGAAIVALGLMNGCNAGQAIGEAAHESARRAAHIPTASPRALRRGRRPLGDPDPLVPGQRGEGHADREHHRRARAAQRADRHHLIRQRAGRDLYPRPAVLYRCRRSRGLGLRAARRRLRRAGLAQRDDSGGLLGDGLLHRACSRAWR